MIGNQNTIFIALKGKRQIKKFKRIRGNKKFKNLKNNKFWSLRKKIYKRKRENESSIISEEKTNINSDTSSTGTNEASHYYSEELQKIIINIKKKYKFENVNGLNEDENELENKINIILSQNKSDKLNIILDVDQTLIYSKEVNEKKMLLYSNNNLVDCHFIEFSFNNKKHFYFIQVRKGIKNFITKLSPYCNFFINSMANPLYIKEILNLLSTKYNLRLTNNGFNNVFITHQNSKKTLPPEITKNGNFLILDDNVCAWDESYFSNIISVRKFYGSYNSINSNEFTYDAIYQYFFFTNKIYCFNELKRQFYNNENKLPFCSEASWSEMNQFDYITDLIIKSYLLNKIINLKISFCYFSILQNILKECKIFYDGDDRPFFQELIMLLGGDYVVDIKEATHILIKNINNKSINEYKDKNYNFIDIEWLFECYFCFIKCDEEKYKIYK